MNYREWLIYRALRHSETTTEPEVLRYETWRNYQALRKWMRRADLAHMNCVSDDKLAQRPAT